MVTTLARSSVPRDGSPATRDPADTNQHDQHDQHDQQLTGTTSPEEDSTVTTDHDLDTVDWIPEHLPEEVRQEILALTEESAPVPMLECSEPLIRHWCEATEDGNPLYLDAEYAKAQGFRGVVAPPTINMTLAIPYRWPAPEADSSPALHYRMKRLMDLPTGVVVDIDTDYLRFVEPGDRLFHSSRLASMSERKKTRIGEGYFWGTESIVRNQRDEVVSRGRTTMFAYKSGLEGAEEAPAPPGLSRATEDALDAGRCSHPPAEQQAYWDEVEEGDELPTLLMPITVTRCIYLASATRDFSPHHSNRDYAQQQVHARDMFLNTPFNAGMLSRFATDWGGPLSRLRNLKLRMRENICAGDDMIINGRVVRKYEHDGEPRVDIDIRVSTEDGPAYEAAATLMLPRARGTSSSGS
jgi:acyl dehydratase